MSKKSGNLVSATDGPAQWRKHDPAGMSDERLRSMLKRLVEHEHLTVAVLVAHLAEFDTRQLYLVEGCSSLFTYCTQVLHLSEHATYARIEAARAARKFPVVLERLADGSINLTTAKLLSRCLTSENCDEILAEARHQPRHRVEEIVARIRPQPPVKSSVRKIPMPVEGSPNDDSDTNTQATQSVSSIESPAQPDSAASDDEESAGGEAVLELEAPTSPPPRGILPLAPGLYKVQATVDRETRDQLMRARDLLRHKIPNGDTGLILKLALRMLVEKASRAKRGGRAPDQVSERRGDSEHPVAEAPANGHARKATRYLPVDVRRRVWERDSGRCAFVGRGGRRCTERGFLEFHHAEPWMLGGTASVDNIELRCRAHNQYESQLIFGQQERRRSKT